jgi:hypothetical protein
MDDRDPPDTNVFRLRRQGDPDEARREQLARTIFARQDESETFSLGNLIPPESKQGDGDEDSEHQPDPFFDRVRQEPQSDTGTTGDRTAAGDSTAAYFDQLSARSAVEMAASAKPSAPAVALPGSAQLPRELPRPARRRRLPFVERGLHLSDGGTKSRRRRALVRSGLAGLLLAAAAIVLMVIASGGTGAHRARAAAARSDALADELGNAIRTATYVSTGVAQFHVADATNHQWRLVALRKVVNAARQTKHHPGSTSGSTPPPSGANTPIATTADGQPSTGGGSGNTEPVASTAAGSTQQSSSSGSRPAFGATGVLGPGSSPNG